MKRKPLVIPTVVLVCVLALGVGAYGVKKSADWSRACEAVTARIAERGPVVDASDGSPIVAILGDSYVMGDGLSDYRDGWAYTLAQAEGWDGLAAGVSSTGYTSGGFCGGAAYADRLPALLEAQPETLIIQGGLNDWEADPDELRERADALLDTAADIPSVVVLGPANAPSRAEGIPAVESALREAAESHGRVYVSALDWNLEFLPDELHLTEAGHDELAEQVAASLD